MKKTRVLILCLWLAYGASAQIEVLQSYKGAANGPAPAHSVELPPLGASPTPATPPAPTQADTAADAKTRRAIALAKVQTAQTKSLVAKGLSPSEYSTAADTVAIAPAEYNFDPPPSTTMTLNGQTVQRNVHKGLGQVGSDMFTPISELHFVQFAVYCKNTPVDKAPPIQGLFLLWHQGSKCPGGDQGAIYIVKGYTTIDEAKAAVTDFKASGIDCWYNPSLSGAEVEIIGVR